VPPLTLEKTTMLNELIKRIQIKSKDAQKEKNETLKHHHLYAMQLDIERTLKLRSEMVRTTSRTAKRNALQTKIQTYECHICHRDGVSTENITQEHIFTADAKFVDVLDLNAKNIFRICQDCIKDISAMGIESSVEL